MTDDELATVARFLGVKQFSKDTVLFKKGDEGNEMYIVKKGRVSSVLIDEDGNKRELATFCAGRFFGEMAIIEHQARSATCIALEDSELFFLDNEKFYQLVWQSSTIGYKLLSAMSHVMSGWLEEASGFLHDMVRWGETARKKAITDSLTGLYNRRFIEDTSQAFFQRHASDPKPAAAMMMDLDHFHALNDKYGHEGGDYIISEVGKAIGKVIPENCVAARLAGDEFSFFIPNAQRENVKEIAELIRSTIEKLTIVTEKTNEAISVTTSIGVAFSPSQADNCSQLFTLADQALFKAKEAGRNVVAYL